jgi:hypothetical protein
MLQRILLDALRLAEAATRGGTLVDLPCSAPTTRITGS